MCEERNQNLETGNHLKCKINANSYTNGIIFIPCILGCRIGVSVMRKEDGGISVKSYLDASYDEITADDKEVKITYLGIPGIWTILFGILILITICLYKNEDAIWLLSRSSLLMAISEIVLVIKLIYEMKISRTLAEMGRYHAAEHKAVNAYKKLGRAPKDIQELNKYSRFCKSCGVKENLKFAVPKITFCITLLCTHDLLKGMIFTIPISIVLLILIDIGAFRFLQIFITQKPTNSELDLALKGIKTVDKFISSARFENVDGKNILHIDCPIE